MSEANGNGANGAAKANKEHYANLPRRVVLRKTAADQCLSTRYWHALILFSFCGPERSDAVVQKDNQGFIQRDHDGNPIPAKLAYIRKFLKIPKENRNALWRLQQAHIEQGLLRLDEAKVMYIVPKPASFKAPKETKNVDMQVDKNSRRNGPWHFGSVDLHVDDLPAAPEAREVAVAWIKEKHANFKTERNAVNAKYAELLCTEGSALGISIGNRRLATSRVDTDGGGSSSVEQRQPAANEAHEAPPPPLLADALKRYGADPEAVSRLLRDCRKIAPGCTEAEICAFIESKAARIARGRIDNPVGFLCTVIPPCFEGDYKSRLREDRTQTPRVAQSSHERAVNEIVTYMIDLENPALSRDEHRIAAEKIAAAPPDIAAEARSVHEAAKPRVAVAAD